MGKKIKLLVMLTKRQPPSSRLRFLDCAEEFLKNGIETTFVSIPSGPLERLKLFLMTKQHDAVVIQKKTSFHSFELFLLRSLNPFIIFDFDDAVMFHELEHGRPLTGKNVTKFLRTIKYCRAAVAGNSFLSEFAKPNCPDVYVLPTPINTETYRLKDHAVKNETFTIGWIGVAGNLKYIGHLHPALLAVTEIFPNTVLKIISNKTLALDGVNVVFKEWKLEDEIEDLRSLDVGIMPLDDSLWARGKCGYKILQYMGVGVPVIASPVGINMDIISHGHNGFLASIIPEWKSCLKQLIVNRELRIEMGLRGYETVTGRYNLCRYSEEYVKIVKSVIGPWGKGA